jgi:hypothetical protein
MFIASFDTLTNTFSAVTSRRKTLGLMAGAALGSGGLRHETAAARKNNKKRHKNKGGMGKDEDNSSGK